jgi:acetoin utilization deacetylase AcuC-like enzyme
MRHSKIATFYMPEQAAFKGFADDYSKSPAKPKLLMDKLTAEGLATHLDLHEFKSFNKRDFYLAHTKEYVDSFYSGEEPIASTNNLQWSKELVKSVQYTNASLYNAIVHSIENPEIICFSPTSGFHHAKPSRGRDFCTFSGQVIASTKIYRKKKLSGAYLDLDEHFGNSIEDARIFVKDLDRAIPEYANINPRGVNEDYLSSLRYNLSILKDKIVNNEIHYVVWCHGADSHVHDQLGGKVNTEYWLMATEYFCNWVKDVETVTGKHLPITISLFGGYRPDSYDSVLSLHIADLMLISDKLIGTTVNYAPEVVPNQRINKSAFLQEISNGETIITY